MNDPTALDIGPPGGGDGARTHPCGLIAKIAQRGNRELALSDLYRDSTGIRGRADHHGHADQKGPKMRTKFDQRSLLPFYKAVFSIWALKSS
jgi:hypothetical protein